MAAKTHPHRFQRREARRRATAQQAIVIGVALLLAVLALIPLLLAQPANAEVQRAVGGQPLSDFVLNDLDGRPVRLSDYTGRPVLINAWATWCPPCRAEMPALHAFYQAHQADGLELLAINAGEAQATAASFITAQGFTFPVLLDPGARLLDALGIRSFPTSVLVGRDGRVKFIHIGLLDEGLLQSEILPLLGQ